MKNIQFKMPAFSLAEALITLLIVCLITLASIPVLTKKKRNAADLASGKWICTLNQYGQYVVYNSSDPFGDINNPNSWRLSDSGNSCTFVPPQNAKNFGLTLIGGGGGGRDGESQMKDLAKNIASYTVQPDDVDEEDSNGRKYGRFRLAVIGGGGGGHGSDDQDGKWKKSNVGIGGQGGAGAYWIGEIKLFQGESLQMQPGIAGEGKCDGGVKCGISYGANNGNLTSSVQLVNSAFITAGGGGNGRSTRNKGGKDPDCGDGGAGGTLTTTDLFKSRILKDNVTPRTSNGRNGRTNTNCRWYSNWCNNGNKITTNSDDAYLGKNYRSYYIKWNGRENCYGIANGVALGDLYDGKSTPLYGNGGYGCHGWGNTCGMNGEQGLILLWQMIEKPGLGGNAAKLTQYTLPNIKGKLVIGKNIDNEISRVGKGGTNNNNGEETRVIYVNSNNKVERVLIANGGTAGGQGAPSSKLYALGSKGENSLWSNKGGGEVGQCKYGGFTTTTEDVTETVQKLDESGEPICLVAAYFLDVVDSTPNTGSTTLSNSCPLSESTNPKGFCAACDVKKYPNDACKYKETLDDDGDAYLEPIGTKIKDYDNKLGNYKLNENLTYYKNHFISYLITGWNHEKSKNLIGYNYQVGEYTCLAYETETRTYSATKTEMNSGYGCDDSLSGTYFGAGGGGGSATSKVGIYGKGGYGAPGAVIIEW